MTVIHVDRSSGPTYPSWTTKVMHPEFEGKGPAEYDIADLQLWLHSQQVSKKVWIRGHVIYDSLKETNLLTECLGLADALAIQRVGTRAFRKFFPRKAIFFWKSVVQLNDGRLRAPYLVLSDGALITDWKWLDHEWNSEGPALRLVT